ncbi:unnamed protein product [Phytophthora lilii]|uniref:Unnamed protein product n=1 Tax=Phytophthora lilii TaxID=2077276 RepID=A0A9W6WWG0_9STRA|nr:unnamed protein product [Phytophthora lilii]
MEKLLAAWDDATAPVDARVRENPLLFASASEIAAFTGVKRLKGPKSDETADTCRPWDHADFLARVGSFSIASWFAKPDVISAFECARHGWRNSAPDQLHCHWYEEESRKRRRYCADGLVVAFTAAASGFSASG